MKDRRGLFSVGGKQGKARAVSLTVVDCVALNTQLTGYFRDVIRSLGSALNVSNG
jgi:hypothetical protein